MRAVKALHRAGWSVLLRERGESLDRRVHSLAESLARQYPDLEPKDVMHLARQYVSLVKGA